MVDVSSKSSGGHDDDSAPLRHRCAFWGSVVLGTTIPYLPPFRQYFGRCSIWTSSGLLVAAVAWTLVLAWRERRLVSLERLVRAKSYRRSALIQLAITAALGLIPSGLGLIVLQIPVGLVIDTFVHSILGPEYSAGVTFDLDAFAEITLLGLGGGITHYAMIGLIDLMFGRGEPNYRWRSHPTPVVGG